MELVWLAPFACLLNSDCQESGGGSGNHGGRGRAVVELVISGEEANGQTLRRYIRGKHCACVPISGNFGLKHGQDR